MFGPSTGMLAEVADRIYDMHTALTTTLPDLFARKVRDAVQMASVGY